MDTEEPKIIDEETIDAEIIPVQQTQTIQEPATQAQTPQQSTTQPPTPQQPTTQPSTPEQPTIKSEPCQIADILVGLDKSADVLETIYCNKKIECDQVDTTSTIEQQISRTASILTSINTIKEQTVRIPIDTFPNEFVDNQIDPFLDILNALASASGNLATSVRFLSESIIVDAKKSKIKDTIDLMYDLNEDCEEVFNAIHKRIKFLLKATKHDF